MTVGSNWVGEGKDPLIRHSPDGDILRCIIELLTLVAELNLLKKKVPILRTFPQNSEFLELFQVMSK
jgi:hypothetical protein